MLFCLILHEKRRLGILIGQINLVSLNPKGFRRSGIVNFGKKTRTLRGQKGMVDAGGSHRAANANQFWMRLPHSSRDSAPIWPWFWLSMNSILKLDPFGTDTDGSVRIRPIINCESFVPFATGSLCRCVCRKHVPVVLVWIGCSASIGSYTTACLRPERDFSTCSIWSYSSTDVDELRCQRIS